MNKNKNSESNWFKKNKRTLIVGGILVLLAGTIALLVVFLPGTLGRQTEFFCRFDAADPNGDVQFYPREYRYSMPYDDRGKGFSLILQSDGIVTFENVDSPGFQFSLKVAIAEVSSGSVVWSRNWPSQDAFLLAVNAGDADVHLDNEINGLLYHDWIMVPIFPSFQGGKSYRLSVDISWFAGRALSPQTLQKGMTIDVKPAPSAPTVDILSPEQGSTFTEGEEIEFAWTYEADYGLDHFEINIGDGYYNIGTTTSVTVPIPEVDRPSTMKLYVKIFDKQGRYDTDDVAFAIIEREDTNPPTTDPPVTSPPTTGGTNTPTAAASLMVIPVVLGITALMLLAKRKKN